MGVPMSRAVDLRGRGPVDLPVCGVKVGEKPLLREAKSDEEGVDVMPTVLDMLPSGRERHPTRAEAVVLFSCTRARAAR